LVLAAEFVFSNSCRIAILASHLMLLSFCRDVMHRWKSRGESRKRSTPKIDLKHAVT
jgi:predicted nucleotidyltransferase